MNAVNEFPLKKAIQLRKEVDGEEVGPETPVKVWRTDLETEYPNSDDDAVVYLIVLIEPYRGFTSSFFGILFVSPIFLDFLSKFAERVKRSGKPAPILEYVIAYGPLFTAYRLFKKSPERFEESKNNAETLEDFVALATIGGD